MAQKFVSFRRAEDNSLPIPPPLSSSSPPVGYSARSRSSKWGSSSPETHMKCRLPDLEMEDIPYNDSPPSSYDDSLPSLSGGQTTVTLWGGLDSSPLPPLPFGVEEPLEQMSAHADWLNLESDVGPIHQCSSSSSSSSDQSSSSPSLTTSSLPSSPSQADIQALPEMNRRTFCERWLEENEREHELCTRALRVRLQNKAKRLEKKIEKVNGVLKDHVNRYERLLDQLKSLNE